LKWAAPKDDGGAPVSHYIVEKQGPYGNTWEEVLTTESPACKARVTGLQEGQTYKFRVRAVNKAGPGLILKLLITFSFIYFTITIDPTLGEPSDGTKPHVAKARFLKPLINREKMQPITFRAGNLIKLDVDVKGEPRKQTFIITLSLINYSCNIYLLKNAAPKLTWMLKGQKLDGNYNIKIEYEDYNTRLNLRETSRELTGKYTLIAENEVGRDEATVEINIIDKPGMCLLVCTCDDFGRVYNYTM
jgi:hypothetical protein